MVGFNIASAVVKPAAKYENKNYVITGAKWDRLAQIYAAILPESDRCARFRVTVFYSATFSRDLWLVLREESPE